MDCAQLWHHIRTVSSSYRLSSNSRSKPPP
jgi:hypothetical protein